MLLMVYNELCVCDLTAVLGVTQPHMSRHLAQLRSCGLVVDRRDGLWIHYRLASNLPAWVDEVLSAARNGTRHQAPFDDDLKAIDHRFATLGSCAT